MKSAWTSFLVGLIVVVSLLAITLYARLLQIGMVPRNWTETHGGQLWHYRQTYSRGNWDWHNVLHPAQTTPCIDALRDDDFKAHYPVWQYAYPTNLPDYPAWRAQYDASRAKILRHPLTDISYSHEPRFWNRLPF